jgi:hypothetical protein
MIAHRTEMLWIEGQKILKAKNDICEDHPYQAEGKKGKGVLFPGLLSFRFYSKKSVKEFFKGTHDRGKESFLLCLKNLEKVASHGFGEKQEYSYKNDQLNPSKNIHL